MYYNLWIQNVALFVLVNCCERGKFLKNNLESQETNFASTIGTAQGTACSHKY